MAGRPLHVRAGRGLRLTPEGEALAARAARALSEVAAAEREMAEIAAGEGGPRPPGERHGPRARPGAARPSGSRASALPGVTCEVEVGPSDQIADLLLAGRLDFALARLPEGRDPALFAFAPMGEEPVRADRARRAPARRGGRGGRPRG